MIESLTIVIPALNEASRLPATLSSIRAHLSAQIADLEVIVVDDGSSDGTSRIAESFGWHAVRTMRHERALGKGAAVRDGVAAATGGWILMTDADLAVPISQLQRLLAHTESSPVVIGSKHLPNARASYPVLRRLGSSIGNLLIRILAVGGFHDTQCGFKLFRADVGKQLFRHTKLNRFGFDFEVLLLARRAGIAIAEVPVECANPTDGSVSLRTYFATLGELVQVAWRKWTGGYPRLDLDVR